MTSAPAAGTLHRRLLELPDIKQRRLGMISEVGTTLTDSGFKRLTATLEQHFGSAASSAGAPSPLRWLRDRLIASGTGADAEPEGGAS